MIHYVRGDTPSAIGVYVVRITDDPFPNDIFLVWDNEYWWNLHSDQTYNGEILGFVGPLERRFK